MAQPTILVVVDRQQLLDQMTAQFFNTNTENAIEAHTISDLQQKLKDDYRGIIVTTVQRFDNMTQVFHRDNIVVMADEAHRSQEGDLGTYMRHALPNASMFGFTGTPIERDDRNTPRNWGRRKPDGSYERYMDPPYRIKDALEDEAIVPIHYRLRLSDWRVHRKDLDDMFERVFTNRSGAEKAVLKQQGSRLSVILKHPERVSQIAQDIARDFKRQVRPNGFKAMLVCHDKETCDLYKTQLDTLLGEDASFVVISEDEKRDSNNVKRHYLGNDQRRRATDEFKSPVPSDPAERAKTEHHFRRAEIVIVCDMLLTGFNAPIVQTMYLDKGLTDYRLLQAIARINRPYSDLKEAGVVLDYYGVFEDLNDALNFERRDVENAAFPYEDFRVAFAEEMATLQNLLSDFDRSGSRDSLMKILVFFGDNPVITGEEGERARDVFETHFKRLRNLYEILSPDGFLQPYLEEYSWFSKLFVLYRKEFYAKDKVDIDELDGQKTRELVRDFVDVEALQKDFPSYTLNADYLTKLEGLEPDAKALKIETTLISILTLDGDDEDMRSLSERLDDVIERKRAGSLAGAELIREFEELSREAIRTRQEDARPPQEALALAAQDAVPDLTSAQADKVSTAMLSEATPHFFPNWFEQPHMESELFRTFTLFLALNYRELELHLPASGFVERAIRILKKRRYSPT